MGQLELLVGAALLGGMVLMATLHWLYQTIRFSSKCPRCGAQHPNRASRKGIMKRIPSKAYHCCGRRFYQLGSRKAAPLHIRQFV